MENEERYASYAAVAGSKAATNFQTSEAVLDSWEDAAQDGTRSQELERTIEEKLGKVKKQSGMQPNASDSTPNHSGTPDDGSFLNTRPQGGESRSSADLTCAGSSAPTIRILKRPQSSGHLPQQGQQPQNAIAADEHRQEPAPNAGPSNDARYSSNGRPGRNTRQNQQQRTLEERAAAYAEARMRIFGVADQQIHDDLPVQPNLSMLPRSNQSSPGSSSNR